MYNASVLATLALILASAHSAETIHPGLTDRIQITINAAGHTKELRLAPDTKIRRTSNLVFEIVLRDEREACELEQTINPYNNSESAPCSHEPEKNTREQAEHNSEHHGIRFPETSEREVQQTYKTADVAADTGAAVANAWDSNGHGHGDSDADDSGADDAVAATEVKLATEDADFKVDGSGSNGMLVGTAVATPSAQGTVQ
jgi:hypothetical protein